MPRPIHLAPFFPLRNTMKRGTRGARCLYYLASYLFLFSSSRRSHRYPGEESRRCNSGVIGTDGSLYIWFFVVSALCTGKSRYRNCWKAFSSIPTFSPSCFLLYPDAPRAPASLRSVVFGRRSRDNLLLLYRWAESSRYPRKSP